MNKQNPQPPAGNQPINPANRSASKKKNNSTAKIVGGVGAGAVVGAAAGIGGAAVINAHNDTDHDVENELDLNVEDKANQPAQDGGHHHSGSSHHSSSSHHRSSTHHSDTVTKNTTTQDPIGGKETPPTNNTNVPKGEVPEKPIVEPPHEPELRVVAYEFAVDEDGNTIEIAHIELDGVPGQIIDYDGDGRADVIWLDDNYNYVPDEGDRIEFFQGGKPEMNELLAMNEGEVIFPEDPEDDGQVHVVEVGTIDVEGEQMDAVILEQNGQLSGLFDVNRDGEADVRWTDTNKNGALDEGDTFEDIRNQGIAMADYEKQYIEEHPGVEVASLSADPTGEEMALSLDDNMPEENFIEPVDGDIHTTGGEEPMYAQEKVTVDEVDVDQPVVEPEPEPEVASADPLPEPEPLPEPASDPVLASNDDVDVSMPAADMDAGADLMA